MELQEVPKEMDKDGKDEQASEPKVEAKTEEETEKDPYTLLQSPPEDIYSEAFHVDSSMKKGPDKQAEGSTNWYRALSLLLLVVCLILVLITIVLGVKLQTGSTLCQGNTETEGGIVRSCSLEQCQGLYPRPKSQCRSCLRCPTKWQRFGDRCFYLSTSRKSWAESQQYCEFAGGSLAVVDSHGLQDFLTNEGNLKYWIGLKRSGGSWMWTDNTAVRQSYWQENASGEDCGILDADRPAEKNWVTHPCQAYSYFICQLF